MKIIKMISVLTVYMLVTQGISAQQTISCCPTVYRYENTSILPTHTFSAGDIIWGDDAGIPNTEGPVDASAYQSQSITFNAAAAIEVNPGSVINPGSALVVGFCDANFALNNHPPVNVIQQPNVFTPNGDGLNDFYMINVNSATYFELKVVQFTTSGNGLVIVHTTGDVTSNWLTLWDGFTGVNTGANWKQNWFLIDVLFNNCKGPASTYDEMVYIPPGLNKSMVPDYSSLPTSINEDALAKLGFDPKQVRSALSRARSNISESSEQELSNIDLNIYPNPTNGYFTLKLSEAIEGGTVELLNSIGQVVNIQQSTNNQMMNFDLRGQAKGVYFIKVTIGDKIRMKQITYY